MWFTDKTTGIEYALRDLITLCNFFEEKLGIGIYILFHVNNCQDMDKGLNINTCGEVLKSGWLTPCLPEWNLSAPNRCLCRSLFCCLLEDTSHGSHYQHQELHVGKDPPVVFPAAQSLNVCILTLLWIQPKRGFDLICHRANQEEQRPNLRRCVKSSGREVKIRCICKLHSLS